MLSSNNIRCLNNERLRNIRELCPMLMNNMPHDHQRCPYIHGMITFAKKNV